MSKLRYGSFMNDFHSAVSFQRSSNKKQERFSEETPHSFTGYLSEYRKTSLHL